MVNPLNILSEGCQIIKDNTGFLLEIYWLICQGCGYWKGESLFSQQSVR